ncbi:Hypothetical predicted protein [Octopus vulgaris]|uniref:Uncharacterized protein n=1 Tax=Octopus vulgaris TaxID=6645 RepID=A0AA36B411_OCTVU|nr:Hypothetical predicted protein [Octopus vulgaris]
MGRRMMDLVQANRGKSFTGDDDKKFNGIGGACRLIQKAILSIQGHYGAATRNHPNDKASMKRAIRIIFKHRSKDHCDCGDLCLAKNVDDKRDPNKNSLPKFVLDKTKPVFVTNSWHIKEPHQQTLI